MEENQYVKISSKTRFLNIFRRIFMAGFIERMLAKRTIDRPPTAFWSRVVPPNFLYPKHSERIAVRHGIKYRLDISDYVEHYIYFGFHDSSHDELFNLAAGKKTLIDVGTNIGSVVLNFAKNSADAVIFGFEPDSKNFAKAKTNIELNDLKNIRLLSKGLGAKPSTVKLHRVNTANYGMNRILGDSPETEGGDFEEIEITTLDDFAAEHHLSNIDLIKIDVEGYELNVLKGAAGILENQSPLLFIELDDDNLRIQGTSAEALITFLEDRNYRVHKAHDKAPVTGRDEFAGCHFDIVCEKITA